MNPQENADLIVVGSGVAGLSAALAGAERGAKVLLITAGTVSTGSSWWAQGGVAAAVGKDDKPAYHAADTLAVGAGLNDRKAVDVLVSDGRREVLRLINEGVPFDTGADGPDLTLEAGHHHRRILHANGGATGEVLSQALLESVLQHEAITILPQTPIDELIADAGRVVGVRAGEQSFYARAVVLATGGYAGLWNRSTNPPGNNGVGLCMAWQAGATLADLEFVQFHPTALSLPGAPAFLLSEALRGEGAKLVDKNDIPVIDPLQPRDVVARAIFAYLRDHGQVYLSLRHLDPAFVHQHFSAIAAPLKKWGLDLARDLLPVAPAAHYCMGGVRTDTEGRTDVHGLYAAGEVACTGVQGANRLASNSLLECLVFGGRAAAAALADWSREPGAGSRDFVPVWHSETLINNERSLGDNINEAAWNLTGIPFNKPATGNRQPATGNSVPGSRLPELGTLDRMLGVERNASTLQELLGDLPEPTCCGPQSGYLVAGLAARAALLRNESRGAHYRTDAPETEPAWRGRILWRRDTAPRFEEVLS